MKDNHEIVKINSLPEIKRVGNKPLKVIVDACHNHVLDEETIRFLERLDAERIIVLAPYHISKLKAKAPIYLASRKEGIRDLLEVTYGKRLSYKSSQLCFSHNQFKIMQLILKNRNESNITSTLNISRQTLEIQKFSIIYKLRLRRMSGIIALGVTSYFQQGHKQLKLVANMMRDADADSNTLGDY